MTKLLLAAALATLSVSAQLSPTAVWATHAANAYQMFPNITYLTANNYENKLDIYKRRDATGLQPTLTWIHGGGRVGGTKEAATMSLMPWFEMGWNVLNVAYRIERVSHAPASVEACLWALRRDAANDQQ